MKKKLKAISRAANDYVGSGGHWMKSKFTGGRCWECKSLIVKRERIWRDTLTSRILCVDCRRIEDPSDQPPSKASSHHSSRKSGASKPSGMSQERAPRPVKQQAPQTSPASDGEYVGFFDGACEGNPGRMGIGVALLKGAVPIESISSSCGTGTSDVAEWRALIVLLELAIKHKVPHLEVCGDSRLIIKQMQGRERIKAEHLREYKSRAAKLRKKIGTVRFWPISREDNSLADKLSKACL